MQEARTECSLLYSKRSVNGFFSIQTVIMNKDCEGTGFMHPIFAACSQCTSFGFHNLMQLKNHMCKLGAQFSVKACIVIVDNNII